MAPQKTPIRRRFGLRAALVFISALCVMVAFIAEERFRYRTEWAPELRAIREIERNGGLFSMTNLFASLPLKPPTFRRYEVRSTYRVLPAFISESPRTTRPSRMLATCQD